MKPLSLKKILSNPLVWIGLVLCYMTIHYEGKHRAFDVFYNLETYRNLAIGATIYACIFRRQYTYHQCRLDIKQTLLACLETMMIILFVWWFSLGCYVSFHVGGENYSDTLREKYARAGRDMGRNSGDTVIVIKKSDIE